MRGRVGQGGIHAVRRQAGSTEGVPRAALSHRHAARCALACPRGSPSLALTFCCMCAWQRVGIVRKLRWGATLKCDAPGAYRLDMTEARFKNSRART